MSYFYIEDDKILVVIKELAFKIRKAGLNRPAFLDGYVRYYSYGG